MLHCCACVRRSSAFLQHNMRCKQLCDTGRGVCKAQGEGFTQGGLCVFMCSQLCTCLHFNPSASNSAAVCLAEHCVCVA